MNQTTFHNTKFPPTIGDFVSLRGKHPDIRVGGAPQRQTRLFRRGFRQRNVHGLLLELGRVVVIVFYIDVEAERKPGQGALGHAGVVRLQFAVERLAGEEDAGVVDAEVVASAAVDADQFERRREELRRETDADLTNARV